MIKSIFKIISVLTALIYPVKVFAQEKIPTAFGEAGDLGEFLSLVLKWGLPIIASLAVIMIMYAGFLYLTSGGNPESTGKAKDILIGVFTGVVLLLLIGLILKEMGIQ